MHKLFRCVLFAVATAGFVTSADAGELTVTIAGGRATVIAKDVTLRQILAEWARVGNTRVVNGEKLVGGPMTLELVDVPEKDALDILLRSAAGYMTGPRPAGVPGASLYDRVMILATSRPPPSTGVGAPPPFNPRTAIQQLPPQPSPDDDDDGDPNNQGPVPPPGMLPFPGPNGPNQGTPFPGQTPGVPNANPNSPNANPNNPNANPNNPNANPTLPPNTAPRPGMLPQQPQPTPVNPYSPLGRPISPNGRGGGPGSDGGPGGSEGR